MNESKTEYMKIAEDQCQGWHRKLELNAPELVHLYCKNPPKHDFVTTVEYGDLDESRTPEYQSTNLKGLTQTQSER
jgi:hypothetical protein